VLKEETLVNDINYGIAWSEKYALGNKQVDSQHRRLFELLSDLVASCLNRTEVTKLKGTLDFLVNYTVQHFNDEEALQCKYDYPDFQRHKQLHEDFKVTVGGLVQKFDCNGSSIELCNDVNKIVVKWLINHIQQEDRKIGKHIRSLTN